MRIVEERSLVRNMEARTEEIVKRREDTATAGCVGTVTRRDTLQRYVLKN